MVQMTRYRWALLKMAGGHLVQVPPTSVPDSGQPLQLPAPVSISPPATVPGSAGHCNSTMMVQEL